MRRSALILCVGLTSALNAGATTFSMDVSDIWYASPAESEAGWGVNVAQQGNILFVTMFVYGANGQPTWFVGSNTAYSGGGGTSMSFSGPLYATGGSAYSAPWNPNALNMRQVGTVTFQLTSATTARLTYTVDGAQVTKNVVRQTWRLNDLSGQYIGALAGTFSQCKNAATNGFTLEYATVAITQQGSSIEMAMENSDGNGRCDYSGTYTQGGRLGSISGNYTCSGGNVGTFTASNVEGSPIGISMELEERASFCNYSGRVGGVRSTK